MQLRCRVSGRGTLIQWYSCCPLNKGHVAGAGSALCIPGGENWTGSLGRSEMLCPVLVVGVEVEPVVHSPHAEVCPVLRMLSQGSKP